MLRFNLDLGEPAEPQRGLFGTIVHETLRDFGGAARTIGAVALSPFDMLGLDVPITIDDLTKRDLKGAGMTAALAAGGLAGKAATSIPFVARVGGAGTATGRALATATTETVAGAAFGLIRPLEEDEERLRAIIGDTLMFGAFGAGASFSKSAVKSVFGGAFARIKEANARHALGIAATKMGEENLVREIAGIKLRHATNKSYVSIRRSTTSPTAVLSTSLNSAGDKVTKKFKDFGEALADATRGGYVEAMGPYREKLYSAAKRFDQTSLDNLVDDSGRIIDELQKVRVGEYRAVQFAAEELRQSNAAFAGLLAEIVAPATELGVPTISKQMAGQLRTLLGKDAKKLSNTELLQLATKRELVTIETIEAGVSGNAALNELMLNGVVPNNANILVTRTNDLFMKSWLTAGTIAKLHPIIGPLVQDADRRLVRLNENMRVAATKLDAMKRKFADGKTEIAGRDIIHNSGYEDVFNTTLGQMEKVPRTLAGARAEALRVAKESGDTKVVEFVDEMTKFLDDYRQRLVDGEIIPEGLPGYFPIINSDNWRVEVVRNGKVTFEGYKGNRKKVGEYADELRAGDPSISHVNVTPNTFWHEGDAIVGMEPRQFGALVRALQESAGFTSGQAKAAASEQARVVAKAPLKTGGNFKQRVLGVQDFSKDPFEALEIYMNGAERVLALRDFDRQAQGILERIPVTQGRLRAWADQYVADILGRPRPAEESFDALLRHMGIDASPRALKRYSTGIRKFESFTRLGGFWSGAVNLTQIPTNTYAKLGIKYTMKGMEVLKSKKDWQRITKILRDAGVEEIEMFLPLTKEGDVMYGTVTEAWKNRQFAETIYRGALFLFNGAEKVNRLVTAWGAYNRALDLNPGMAVRKAGALANEAVKTTQFNYRLSNMPEILRGPVGATLLQFKSFVINELEFMAGLNSKEFARFGAGLWATGGAALLLNTPGVDLADAASGLFFDKKMSEALKLAPGENRLARGVVFGLPGLLTKVGADMSDYVGVGSLADVTRGVWGPAGSDLINVTTFIKDAGIDMSSGGRVRNETKQRLMQRSMPSMLRRAFRAQDIFATGEVRDPYRGKLLYRPDARAREAFQTFIGAPSIRMSQERAMEQIVTRTRERYINAHSEYAKEAAQAIIDGRGGDVAGLKAEALQGGITLEDKSIQYQIKQFSQTAQERRVRRTPVARRAQIEEMYDALGFTDAPARNDTAVTRFQLGSF